MDVENVVDLESMDVFVFAGPLLDFADSDDCCLHRAYSNRDYAVGSFDDCSQRVVELAAVVELLEPVLRSSFFLFVLVLFLWFVVVPAATCTDLPLN